MKTTLDIPEDVLRETIRHTGAKTKREAVVIALASMGCQPIRLGQAPHVKVRDPGRKIRLSLA